MIKGILEFASEYSMRVVAASVDPAGTDTRVTVTLVQRLIDFEEPRDAKLESKLRQLEKAFGRGVAEGQARIKPPLYIHHANDWFPTITHNVYELDFVLKETQ